MNNMHVYPRVTRNCLDQGDSTTGPQRLLTKKYLVLEKTKNYYETLVDK